jgi:hypothetical protein
VRVVDGRDRFLLRRHRHGLLRLVCLHHLTVERLELI